MKTRILGRVRQQAEEWLADAYQREAVFCSVRAKSRAEAPDRLKPEAESPVVALAQNWIKSWEGSDRVPNCPESKIKLPIDLWYCKLVDKKCPIQCQVFLDKPSLFFESCLASPEEKQQIFDTVAKENTRASIMCPAGTYARAAKTMEERAPFATIIRGNLLFSKLTIPLPRMTGLNSGESSSSKEST